MKILYYSPHPHLSLDSPSGPGTHIREMIKAFRSLGHEVEVLILGPKDTRGSNAKAEVSGSKKILKNIFPKLIWETVKDLQLISRDKRNTEVLEKKIKEFNPDLIYERGYYLMTSGVRAAQKLKIPHIMEMNAPFLYEKKYMTGQKSLLNGRAGSKEKEQLKKTNLVVTVSSALKDHFVKEYKIEEKKILVASNGVDPSEINIDPEKAAQLRKELRCNEQDLIIGFVGSIFPYHGVDELINAFAEVRKKNENLKLLIVGDGESLPSLKELAKEHDLKDSVIFTGNIEHGKIFNYISLMDITVMARSNWYGSPVKIFEYGIMGKAVIAPDNIPVNDVMKNGEDGILIKDNVKELETALLKMANEKIFREKVGKHFQEKVSMNYTWKIIAANVLDAYSKSKIK